MASLETFAASIVAVGSFNPPLVSVDWLQANGLVGEGDAAAARDRPDYIVSRPMTRFQTTLALLQVLDNQISIASSGPVSPALNDLACGIFDLLPHTPVTAIGLNFMAHYKLQDIDTYHRIGDHLVPKGMWESLFPSKIIGMADLTVIVQDGKRDELMHPLDYERVTIQPSKTVQMGVFVQMNAHHGMDTESQPLKSAAGAAAVARKYWASTNERSMEIFNRLIAAAGAPTK